jgi:hypothetical protein
MWGDEAAGRRLFCGLEWGGELVSPTAVAKKLVVDVQLCTPQSSSVWIAPQMPINAHHARVGIVASVISKWNTVAIDSVVPRTFKDIDGALSDISVARGALAHPTDLISNAISQH